MEFIEAKTIISKVKDGKFWYGVDYNMNLYRGCSHGCIYCDSRSNCYRIDNFDKVRAKKDALLIMEKELSKFKRSGVVGIGAMSDTYNSFEVKYELTRGALKLIRKYGFGVSIDTKSDLILRDLDILSEINKKNYVVIKLTVTTPHDAVSRVIEPYAPVTSKRLQAIKKLSDAGIFVGIMLNPVLPFITDSEEDICLLVKKAHESGARFIHTYMGVTLRENQRDYYYSKLDSFYPGLKEKYIANYGESYECNPKNYKYLYQVFTHECERYGILYRMDDIICEYRSINKGEEQISLF